MKVIIMINETITEPFIEIHTNEITDEIKMIQSYFNKNKKVALADEEVIKILKPEAIYLIKSIDGKLNIYTKDKTYYSNKKLYEVPTLFGSDFMRISKNTYINLKHIDFVEATFSGLMKVKLLNNQVDYISRMYVKDLKKYFNL